MEDCPVGQAVIVIRGKYKGSHGVVLRQTKKCVEIKFNSPTEGNGSAVLLCKQLLPTSPHEEVKKERVVTKQAIHVIESLLFINERRLDVWKTVLSSILLEAHKEKEGNVQR